MKKLDTLNRKRLKPKKTTVNFLLSFSKSIEILKAGQERYKISKN